MAQGQSRPSRFQVHAQLGTRTLPTLHLRAAKNWGAAYSVVLSRSAATNTRKELDKLFDVVAKAVTTNHKPPYDDAESLKLLAPLLTVRLTATIALGPDLDPRECAVTIKQQEALVTKRKVLKNAAIQFWNATCTHTRYVASPHAHAQAHQHTSIHRTETL